MGRGDHDTVARNGPRRWGDRGHILMSSNCIHEDVKPENFFAYVQAYRDYFGLR